MSLDVPLISNKLTAIKDPSLESAAFIASILSQAGVPTALALWGLNAASLYGENLVPLDIELPVRDKDQKRAFTVLTSHGLIPSLPDDDGQSLQPPVNIISWRQEYSSPDQYRDRRAFRHGAPIYEVPPQPDSDSEDVLFLHMFIILYSAEFAGDPQKPLYVPLATLSAVASKDNIRSEFGSCLIPTFQRLVESEIHVIRQEPSHHSITWGQHMAQLAALSRSRYCPRGLDGLPGIVDSRFVPFASWVGRARKVGGDFVEWKRLQESFRRHGAGANRRLSTITKCAFSAAGGFLRQTEKALIIALDSILPTLLSEWIGEAFSKGRG